MLYFYGFFTHIINVRNKRLYLPILTSALHRMHLGRVEIGAVGAANPAGLIKNRSDTCKVDCELCPTVKTVRKSISVMRWTFLYPFFYSFFTYKNRRMTMNVDFPAC